MGLRPGRGPGTVRTGPGPGPSLAEVEARLSLRFTRTGARHRARRPCPSRARCRASWGVRPALAGPDRPPPAPRALQRERARGGARLPGLHGQRDGDALRGRLRLLDQVSRGLRSCRPGLGLRTEPALPARPPPGRVARPPSTPAPPPHHAPPRPPDPQLSTLRARRSGTSSHTLRAAWGSGLPVCGVARLGGDRPKAAALTCALDVDSLQLQRGHQARGHPLRLLPTARLTREAGGAGLPGPRGAGPAAGAHAPGVQQLRVQRPALRGLGAGPRCGQGPAPAPPAPLPGPANHRLPATSSVGGPHGLPALEGTCPASPEQASGVARGLDAGAGAARKAAPEGVPGWGTQARVGGQGARVSRGAMQSGRGPARSPARPQAALGWGATAAESTSTL